MTQAPTKTGVLITTLLTSGEIVPLQWASIVQPSDDVSCPYCDTRQRRQGVREQGTQMCVCCGGIFWRW